MIRLLHSDAVLMLAQQNSLKLTPPNHTCSALTFFFSQCGPES